MKVADRPDLGGASGARLTPGPDALPSISRRLTRSLWLSAGVWGLALSLAAWLAVRHELNELLDETLLSAAQGLWAPLSDAESRMQRLPPAPPQAPAPAAAPAEPDAVPTATPAAKPVAPLGPEGEAPQFVWQLVRHEGTTRVQRASATAPSAPFHQTPTAGLSDVADWRVAGVATGRPGELLYVAQTRAERFEAQAELALALVLATLPMAVLAVLWLRRQITEELSPLQRLSLALARHDGVASQASLGVAERAELQPVHEAIEQLTLRLARRAQHERAINAHAAHALRTPLAGLDAQLAAAQLQAAPDLQARLARMRAASGRLQRVVTTLLTLFRSGMEVQASTVDVAALVARLPLEGLLVTVQEPSVLHGDADLLTAALLNLLDNALRHGAHRATVSVPTAQVLRVQDDGPGVSEQRHAELALALEASEGPDRNPNPDTVLGLGLTLVQWVARAHGGRVVLPTSASGFVAELHLAAADAGAAAVQGEVSKP